MYLASNYKQLYSSCTRRMIKLSGYYLLVHVNRHILCRLIISCKHEIYNIELFIGSKYYNIYSSKYNSNVTYSVQKMRCLSIHNIDIAYSKTMGSRIYCVTHYVYALYHEIRTIYCTRLQASAKIDFYAFLRYKCT